MTSNLFTNSKNIWCCLYLVLILLDFTKTALSHPVSSPEEKNPKLLGLGVGVLVGGLIANAAVNGNGGWNYGYGGGHKHKPHKPHHKPGHGGGGFLNYWAR